MLARRCDAFYDGHADEARDIASILRKLLYDYGSSSQSLLGQIGIKEEYQYLDSRVHGNLHVQSMKGAWPRTVLPYEYYADKYLYPFKIWWEKQPFHVLYQDIIFTRKDLVLEIANREGGDHIDPHSDRRIATLMRKDSPWSTHISDGESTVATPMNNFELATICAIGEELLWTLEEDKEEAQKRMHSSEEYLSRFE